MLSQVGFRDIRRTAGPRWKALLTVCTYHLGICCWWVKCVDQNQVGPPSGRAFQAKLASGE